MLRISESQNLRISESQNLWISEFVNGYIKYTLPGPTPKKIKWPPRIATLAASVHFVRHGFAKRLYGPIFSTSSNKQSIFRPNMAWALRSPHPLSTWLSSTHLLNGVRTSKYTGSYVTTQFGCHHAWNVDATNEMHPFAERFGDQQSQEMIAVPFFYCLSFIFCAHIQPRNRPTQNTTIIKTKPKYRGHYVHFFVRPKYTIWLRAYT